MLTTEQKIYLATCEDFQKVLAEDPVLADLEAQQYDPAKEFYTLMEFFRGTFTIGTKTIQPLTPAVWAFLWGIGNHYAGDLRKVTESDTDVFLYVLSHGVRSLGCYAEELPALASGYCAKAGLGYEEATRELVQVVNAAFRPYEMLPKTAGNSGPPPLYDAYWLAQLCSVVAQETGEKAREVMFDMPLSACHLYFLNFIRKNDPKSQIRRRSPEEVQKEIFQRVEKLSEEYISRGGGGK